MSVQVVALVLESPVPGDLAGFWAHALGWGIRHSDDGAVELVPTDATSFRIACRPGAHAKVGQNVIHFDLTTTSLDHQNNTVADLVANGARHINIGQSPDDTHVVLADPDGNEFCVLAPFNNFLAGCPRLGAVNCDGTHALGQFFAAALDWPLVWDQDEETAIQSPDATGPKITWSGPPLMPKSNRERFHFHLSSTPGANPQAALDRLDKLGATPIENIHHCPGATPMADVDGNAFCFVQ